ncbi:putative RecA/RadA family phage recombinase [Defluviimonas denitrificans]|jgi:predicted RecA/RadA family phage recombinase|uniref:Putative RecA/RadA family phage recombinase n=1 Tax=Albidovulum denitrificans TaxID=404881 RepID=A0A2S8RWG6_9RHOB|nr:DUF2190 family protein [Defluviimonas denitrificans]PQV52890.1 putative RecA/RadA family phage recombinase [Defluviimonas denitrificans]
MKNYVQDGVRVTVPAPYDVLSGGGLLVGTLFGIAVYDATSGNDVLIQTTGVVQHAKTSAQAWTVGAAIYWDDTNKVLTTTATGNTLVGKALQAAVNPSATGIVRLNG